MTRSPPPAGPRAPSREPGRPDNAACTRATSDWARRDGVPLPLGACWIEAERAYNFALYSKHATRVALLLFDDARPERPHRRIELDPLRNKSGRVWHCRVPRADVAPCRLYAYSVDGPAPLGVTEWHAFDPDKVLLDPYARAIWFPPTFRRSAAMGPGSNAGRAPLGVLPEPAQPQRARERQQARAQQSARARERQQARAQQSPRARERQQARAQQLPQLRRRPRARPPRPRPWHDADAIVYELHVKGFTAHPSSGVAPDRRGTYAGLVDKIPHLVDLGVTVVELMPVHQYDPQEGNFWGYMPLGLFAPHRGYARDAAALHGPVAEFRAMVDALHDAGIEVILDVVYNHTAEGDHAGPCYSFKGIDNSTYYLATGDPRAPYANFSGTGNSLNCNNRYVRKMIVDSMRYWYSEMGVDGFRFDLASIFARRPDGTLAYDPPIFGDIASEDELEALRLIAEPWDAAGAYQLGRGFPGLTWYQWNDRFRDDVRRFVRGDRGMLGPLARRLYGSDDVFPDDVLHACRPYQSVNYVAAHDGFTLYDLVSYRHKRNRANGHDNRDGPAVSYSWNSGHEGDDGAPPDVIAARVRHIKNLACLVLLSNGTPMLRAGDEFACTQGGNDNPYNQDNPTGWLDWRRLDRHRDVFRFFRRMIAFRRAHPSLARSRFWRDDVRWYGPRGDADWGPDARELAVYLRGDAEADDDLYILINGGDRDSTFCVQDAAPGRPWRRVIDTADEDPPPLDAGPPVRGDAVQVRARSIAVLVRARET